jgi:hypothetical protein
LTVYGKIVQDCYRALAISDSAFYEITLFSTEKSVLMIDEREGFIVGDTFTIPSETPLLDYHFIDPQRDEWPDPPEPRAVPVPDRQHDRGR